MNKNIGAGLAAVVIFIGAALGHYYFTKGTPMATSDEHTATESTHTEESSAADHSTADHMKMMDDGRTVMAMGGMMSPSVLHAAASQALRLVNHEAAPVKIVFTASGIETVEVPPGGEAYFTAPVQVGRYEYHSSQNANIKGVIVVEQ
ncbi:MAG: cupredoxin domain-containing protein [Candidatus Pacebacteria bacterium]|nr:cupredoxin domain-containing protein [Candidatus Paceibacterota bacterium]